MAEEPRRASQISLEEFTEVTVGAVLRAIEARKFPRGPIIIGIIYTPEGLTEAFGQAAGVRQEEGQR